MLEARDRVGGRTLTVDLAGEAVDLGGQWMGPTQDRVLALAAELGIETFPQYAQGKKVLDFDGERRTYSGLLPKIPLLALAELGLSIQRLERMARKVPLDRPASAEGAAELDAVTVADWLARNVRSRGARTRSRGRSSRGSTTSVSSRRIGARRSARRRGPRWVRARGSSCWRRPNTRRDAGPRRSRGCRGWASRATRTTRHRRIRRAAGSPVRRARRSRTRASRRTTSTT